MAQPLQTAPLSTVHAKDGDILTLGRWESVQPNPLGDADWTFQQFDVVFTTGEQRSGTVTADSLTAIVDANEWGVFAIKRPQTAPPVIEAADVPEEAPTDS